MIALHTRRIVIFGLILKFLFVRYLVLVDLKALKSSAESAVTEMSDNFVLATADFFRAENHAFDPDEMTSVFAAINRPIVV